MKRMYRWFAWALVLALMLSEAALAELSRGDRGSDVAAVQQQLIDMGYLNDVADGIFGGKTEAAVAAFQQVCGLEPTGAVDDATAAALAARASAGNAPAEASPAEAPQAPVAQQVQEEAAAEPAATPEPVSTPVPVPSGDRFAGIQVTEGCGWVDDAASPVYALGRNAAGEHVIYGISVMCVNVPQAVALTSLSWTDSYRDDASDMLFAWEAAKLGHTSVNAASYNEINQDGQMYRSANVDIYLPDDPALAGEQSFTLSMGASTALVRVTLEYMGNYTEGTGWKVTLLDVTVQ